MAVSIKKAGLVVVPTLLTLMNGVCGLGSIAMATLGRDEIGETNAIFYAGTFIFVGMVFDALDGYVARLLKQTSQFGAELDSLCDVITFTVAPVFIMLSLTDVFPLRFLWSIGVLFMLCGVLRLARFNVELVPDDDHEWFRGLPSPAAAGTLASFAVTLPTVEELLAGTTSEASRQLGEQIILLSEYSLPVLTVTLAALMVSRIRYPHILSQVTHGQWNFFHLVRLIFVVVALVTVHELALPIVFCYFSLGRPIALWLRFIGLRLRGLTPFRQRQPREEV
ncbi:MAG: CDP-diacylglycerol--serine O-phosphatidyltransferase [Planctomycetaceae bacterium]|nr:CDP-diacylglycerol--serine O-phosphatidyltransferase [Planctomycetales bacterium]MCB9874041.1 CDP-diacylglycerol--serine O-phosphatidyltransferase [Planctomycetaceae bacterium]MCB9937705.1 CDP-diacylglycerol--serine O-phosphatidyltransferase [Planctomycetaceae bacterium]HRX78898.1 CDP-diacylglycerol--serine O-phosphatidyltransferase [Pirellulaceae bacterium]